MISLGNDLSDFNNMVVIVYKTHFQKSKLQRITYQDFITFNDLFFRNELESSIQLYNDHNSFHDCFVKICKKACNMQN